MTKAQREIKREVVRLVLESEQPVCVIAHGLRITPVSCNGGKHNFWQMKPKPFPARGTGNHSFSLVPGGGFCGMITK
jgi:hypothetical protein